jgi:hypothetical protein
MHLEHGIGVFSFAALCTIGARSQKDLITIRHDNFLSAGYIMGICATQLVPVLESTTS